MAKNVDLNELREMVLTNQKNNTENPENPREKVVVDKDGKIRLGESENDREGISEVPQDEFASITSLQ